MTYQECVDEVKYLLKSEVYVKDSITYQMDGHLLEKNIKVKAREENARANLACMKAFYQSALSFLSMRLVLFFFDALHLYHVTRQIFYIMF